MSLFDNNISNNKGTLFGVSADIDSNGGLFFGLKNTKNNSIIGTNANTNQTSLFGNSNNNNNKIKNNNSTGINSIHGLNSNRINSLFGVNNNNQTNFGNNPLFGVSKDNNGNSKLLLGINKNIDDTQKNINNNSSSINGENNIIKEKAITSSFNIQNNNKDSLIPSNTNNNKNFGISNTYMNISNNSPSFNLEKKEISNSLDFLNKNNNNKVISNKNNIRDKTGQNDIINKDNNKFINKIINIDKNKDNEESLIIFNKINDKIIKDNQLNEIHLSNVLNQKGDKNKINIINLNNNQISNNININSPSSSNKIIIDQNQNSNNNQEKIKNNEYKLMNNLPEIPFKFNSFIYLEEHEKKQLIHKTNSEIIEEFKNMLKVQQNKFKLCTQNTRRLEQKYLNIIKINTDNYKLSIINETKGKILLEKLNGINMRSKYMKQTLSFINDRMGTILKPYRDNITNNDTIAFNPSIIEKFKIYENILTISKKCFDIENQLIDNKNILNVKEKEKNNKLNGCNNIDSINGIWIERHNKIKLFINQSEMDSFFCECYDGLLNLKSMQENIDKKYDLLRKNLINVLEKNFFFNN